MALCFVSAASSSDEFNFTHERISSCRPLDYKLTQGARTEYQITKIVMINKQCCAGTRSALSRTTGSGVRSRTPELRRLASLADQDEFAHQSDKKLNRAPSSCANPLVEFHSTCIVLYCCCWVLLAILLK